MEHLRYLGGERASPPKFSEVTITGYLPNSSTWLQGVCESHGAVFVQFVGGCPPLFTDGTILNIWNFSIELLHGNTVFVVDFAGDARWVIRKQASGPLTPSFAELCCGLGGWTCGMDVMNKSLKDVGYTIMVDIDEGVAKAAAFRLNFPCMSVDEAYSLISDACILSNIVIIGDIRDKRVWTIISVLGVQTILTSPPCPPWSNAARKEGLSAKDGLVFPSLIQMAEHVGVRLIVAENVASIEQHQHFGPLRYFAKKCGFTMVHSDSIDAFPFLPIKRNRWIAAFARHDLVPDREILDMVNEYKFPRIKMPLATMGARDCLHPSLQDYEKIELQPSSLAMVKMCCGEFLPKSFVKVPGSSILQSRIKTSKDPLQSAMASYGSQHELDDLLLREKGLFTILCSQNDDRSQPRYYSPFEFLASMAWPANVVLPSDIKQAWKAAGNSITIPHVVLALFKSHAVLGKNSPWGSMIFNLRDLMSVVLSERITLTHFRQVVKEFRQLEPCTALTTQGGSNDASNLNTTHPSSSPGPGLSVVESVMSKEIPEVVVNEPTQNKVEHNLVESPPVHKGFGFSGELFNCSSVECEPPIVVKSRKTICKDPLWEAANEYEPCSPGIEIADSILECAKIIPRDSSDPTRSLHSAFDMVKDDKGERGIKGKRPFQDHDTWGLDSFRKEPDFHESKGCRFSVDHDMWLRDMEKKLFDTGVARIWPMTRMVLFVNALNHWNVLIPVEYQLSVMGMFKKILPHAIPQNFQGVQVNGQEVCPGSIPAGLGKLVISFLPLECQVPIVFMNGEVKSIGCDVTTTCEELIQKICEGFGLHSSSFRIVCDDLPISRKSFVLGSKDGQWKIVKAIFVKLPSDVPTVYSPVDFTFPPKHSDVFVPAPVCSIRMAARHPVWSTVRTVSVSLDASLGEALAMLFPDLTFKCSIVVANLGEYMPDGLKVRCLNQYVRHEVAFHSTKDFPVTDLELIEKVSFPDQMKIGDPDRQEQPVVKRWIKSPFQSKAYEKHFYQNASLVKIAGSYFAHADSKQALLVLQDGKCIDPRTLIKDVPEISIITIRACPLLGGAKNADVRKMLHDQLLARGVGEDDIPARIDAVLAKIQPDKLRMHVAEADLKQWSSIKHLANEAKIRLITIDELRRFQSAKKTERAETQSSASTAGPKSTASSSRKAADMSEVKVDLSYFVAADKAVTPLASEHFGPDAVGVAVMHADKAEKFLPPSKLSSDHLAIVAVGVKSIGNTQSRMIPATNCKGEPMLVAACLLNFGDVEVTFQNGNVTAELHGQDAMVIEFSIIRKETEKWDLVKSPMLYLGQNFSDIKNAKILSSWAVRFFTDAKKQTEHSKADYVHGFFRVLVSQVDGIIAKSGWAGVYMTPKNASKRPHEAYQIINVPNRSIEELRALAQKTLYALGVVRTNSSLAIRCRREHGNQVQKALFPDMPAPEVGQFEAGDLLFTLKHVSVFVPASELTKALGDLGWEGAKALRPLGASSWSVAAKRAPPASHLCINGEFAVVVPNAKTSSGVVSGFKIPKDANVSPVASECLSTPSVVSGPARIDELRLSLQTEIKSLVDAKMSVQQDEIEKIKQSVKTTSDDVKELRENQVQSEARIKQDIEGTLKTSAANMLNQMSTMFQNLQTSLTERLEKIENKEDPESQESKRQKRQS